MTKSQTYTDEETVTLKKMYQDKGNEGLEEISTTIGKSINSIRAKLVREKLYITPDKPLHNRKNGPSKKEILRDLETLGLSIEGVDGLKGATKTGLSHIKAFISKILDE